MTTDNLEYYPDINKAGHILAETVVTKEQLLRLYPQKTKTNYLQSGAIRAGKTVSLNELTKN